MMTNHEKKMRAIEVGRDTREKYEHYLELKELGYSRSAIAEKLGINPSTIRVWDRAEK